MLFMIRILQSYAKFNETGDTAYIFRRTGPFAFKTGQLRSQFWAEIAAVLENKFMFPAVPEVIQITECTAFLFDQITETVFATDQTVIFEFRVFRVALIPDAELVKMAVSPSHYNLDDIMQPVQRDAGGNDKAPPDGRLNFK